VEEEVIFAWEGVMKEKFSKDFQRVRESKGWTREECGKVLKVSGTAIQNWENPEHRSFPKAARWELIKQEMDLDPMEYKYGPITTGNRSVAVLNASNGATVNAGCDYGQQATSGHQVVLSDFEFILYTLWKQKGGNPALGEKCLQNLLAINK